MALTCFTYSDEEFGFNQATLSEEEKADVRLVHVVGTTDVSETIATVATKNPDGLQMCVNTGGGYSKASINDPGATEIVRYFSSSHQNHVLKTEQRGGDRDTGFTLTTTTVGLSNIKLQALCYVSFLRIYVGQRSEALGQWLVRWSV